MQRIIWRSWSKLEAEIETQNLQKLPLQNQWLNGHTTQPSKGDIYLTTNGYDYRPGQFWKITVYAESYTYLNNEYNQYDKDNKWYHRFHFNPNYAAKTRSSKHGIGCFWKHELPLFEEIKKNKKHDTCFGMVLGYKGKQTRKFDCDIGYFRDKVVMAGKNRSFKYYGTDWPKGDPNYKGNKYINGHRGSPIKFNDARRLMSDVKFVIAIENCHHKIYSLNYLTEKIFHAFISCSIPIYLGCWNIEEMINPNLFIDIRKFDMDMNKVFKYCEKMPDSEYKGYIDRIIEFMHGPALKFSCDERFLKLDRKILKVINK